MRKGDFVQLNPKTCFTIYNGGDQPFCHYDLHNDKEGIVRGYYYLSEKEIKEWRENPLNGGLDCAGEPELPPKSGVVLVSKNDIMQVEKARCKFYGLSTKKQGGYAKVHLARRLGSDITLNLSFYIKRNLLEIV